MSTETKPTASLAEALTAFQLELPYLGKDNTAKVEGKEGKAGFVYKYADLADVSRLVLPLLAKHGLSFSAKPTIDEAGRFVLAYTLRHVGGEEDSGSYPLPTATPQQVGSAITYARRYALCAVTGVAPDADDDGHAANDTRVQPERYVDPEVAAGQAAKFAELTKLLADATTEPDLKAAWEKIVAAYKADELTTVQANRLRADLDARKAEFAGAP